MCISDLCNTGFNFIKYGEKYNYNSKIIIFIFYNQDKYNYNYTIK